MNLIRALCVIALITTTAEVYANDENVSPARPESHDYALNVLSPHPFIFGSASVTGTEYLEATLDVTNNGAALSFAPGLVNTEKYIEILSETRILLQQEEDGISTGLSFKYNPLNSSSKNGRTIWDDHFTYSNVILDPTGVISARNSRINQLRELEADLLIGTVPEECIQGKYEDDLPRINATLQNLKKETSFGRPSDAVITEVRCVFYLVHVYEMLFEGLTADQVAEQGIEKKEAELKALKAALSPYVESVFWFSAGEDKSVLTELSKLRLEKTLLETQNNNVRSEWSKSLYLGYQEKLNNTLLPVIEFSYRGKFTGIFSGRPRNDEGQKDKRLLSRAATVSLKKNISTNQSIDFAYSRNFQRQSATTGDKSSTNDSYGLTWQRRLLTLDPNYKKSDAYKKSLFVPSVNLGLALEHSECKSEKTQCKDSELKKQVATVFFDTKISQTAQFRIGLPWQEKTVLEEDSENNTSEVSITAAVKITLGPSK